jgi:tetratricopeptide (TPR) repeat protein
MKKMKKTILALCTIAIIASCNNKSGSSGAINNYKKLFDKSMNSKDFSTAIVAAQLILVEDSTLLLYADTLPELYAATNNIMACNDATAAAIKRNPTSERLLLIKALCAEQIGDVAEQMSTYNQLYSINKKPEYLYRITAAHFGTGNFKAVENNLKELDQLALTTKDSIDFMISESEKQKVPLKAALLNMRAIMAAQKDRDMASAKKYFEAAIREFPDFIVAKEYYKRLMNGGK